MATLAEVLADPSKKKAVIEDGVRLIDDEVSAKGGFGGIALKTAYKTFKKIKPGMVHTALAALLPDFAPAVDPYFAEARAGGDVRDYFVRNGDAIAEALLGVTDAKAARAENRLMLKLYSGLRKQAKGHVVAAMPGLASMIERHV